MASLLQSKLRNEHQDGWNPSVRDPLFLATATGGCNNIMARPAMKFKKIKFIVLLVGLFIATFCLDLSINAKILNVDIAIETQQLSNKSSIPLSPWIVSLISIGIIGMVVFSRRAVSHDSIPTHRRNLPKQSTSGYRWIAPDSHVSNSSSIEI